MFGISTKISPVGYKDIGSTKHNNDKSSILTHSVMILNAINYARKQHTLDMLRYKVYDSAKIQPT